MIHQYRQPVRASGDYAVDPQLETRLEDGGQETGKKCRSLAAPGAALGQHEIKWEWVKGHAEHPENNCDELARAAASNPTRDDIGYRAES